MRLGYNTNGLAHHRLLDAIDFWPKKAIEALRSPSMPGRSTLTTTRPYSVARLMRLRAALDRHGLARVVETGARYLLNPRKKHDPTLMDPDPARRDVRLDFLRAPSTSPRFSRPSASRSGGAGSRFGSDELEMDRIAQALKPLLDHAEKAGMILAFEPEPGYVHRHPRPVRRALIVHHPLFQLTIDLGHVHCLKEGDIPPYSTIGAAHPEYPY